MRARTSTTAVPFHSYVAARAQRCSLDNDEVPTRTLLAATLVCLTAADPLCRHAPRSTWPPAMSAMLSLFHVGGGGALLLDNCTVEVDDVRGVVESLRQLPGCCSADPSRPNLQPQVDAWPSFGPSGGATSSHGGSGSGGSGSTAGSYGLSESDDGMGEGSSSGAGSSAAGVVGKVLVGKIGSGFTIRSWVLPQELWMQVRTARGVWARAWSQSAVRQRHGFVLDGLKCAGVVNS